MGFFISKPAVGRDRRRVLSFSKETLVTIRQKVRSWFAIVVGFVAVTLGGFRSTAWSEDVAPPAASELEQRVRILERKLEINAETAAAKEKETVAARAGADGFQIQSADKAFALKFGLLLQA